MSRYIKRITQRVEERVARELPSSFGLVMDGWTSSGRHYVAIFAVFPHRSATSSTNDSSNNNNYCEDFDCSS